MLPSIQALFSSIVDYAGTFPPASLSGDEALAEYARARRGDDAWLLSGFVLPLELVERFQQVGSEVIPAGHEHRWPLNVILPADSLLPSTRAATFQRLQNL